MPTIVELYQTFAAAQAACGAGYDDDVLAEVTAFKTEAARQTRLLPEREAVSLHAVGAAAHDAAGGGGLLRVLDFGGGCGLHYFRARMTLPLPLRWAVVETGAMVARAAAFASGELSFHTTIDQAVAALGDVDLVHSSGAIQYVSDPRSVFERLLALGAPRVVLARFPIWGHPTVVGVQVSELAHNGLGPMPPHIPNRLVHYPVTLWNGHEMTACMQPAYGVELLFESPDASYAARGQPAPGVSYLLRRCA